MPTKGFFFENYITIVIQYIVVTPILLSVIYYQIIIFNYKKKGKCPHYANIT